MPMTPTPSPKPQSTSRGDVFTPPSPLSTGSVLPDLGVIPLQSVLAILSVCLVVVCIDFGKCGCHGTHPHNRDSCSTAATWKAAVPMPIPTLDRLAG